jgi:zinc metalloprotease ZmpA
MGVKTESPGVCEATSDLFAMLVSDNWGDHNDIPYWIGEQVMQWNYSNGVMVANPTLALRQMDDPTRLGYPVCYSPNLYTLDPHAAGSPAGHAFYLMAYGGNSACNGGAVTAISHYHLALIFYNAFYALPSNVTYAVLKNEFYAAANRLFPGPSAQTTTVTNAFLGIGVQ